MECTHQTPQMIMPASAVAHIIHVTPTSVFLSRFWVSKWHPKILKWHPKFWKPRYGFALYWSKTIWDKHIFLHVAIAADGCNVIGRHNFLMQKLEAKIVSLVSVHYHAHHFTPASITILPQICTVWCTKLQKHFNAIMEVFYCFTVAIGLPVDASQWRQKVHSCSVHAKQGDCRVRQQWELGVKFWLFRLHWSSCQKIKMMQCALFYCNL